MKIAGQPVPHESARGHVTGEALYTDDLAARFPRLLHAWPVLAPHAHALVTRLDASPALAEPGVRATLTARRRAGRGRHRRQSPRRAAVSARSDVSSASRWPGCWAKRSKPRSRGAARVQRDIRSRCRRILTIEEAIAAESFHSGPLRLHARRCRRRSRRAPLPSRRRARDRRAGALLSRNAMRHRLAGRTGGVAVHSSTQHPSETQEVVARVLGSPRNQVTVECLRMGGAFGGKEVQANPWAAIAALGAWKTRRPGARAPDARARHGAHRQAPSVPGALRGGLRRRRAGSQALRRRALFRRRLEPRSFRAGPVARAVPLRQRLLSAGGRR